MEFYFKLKFWVGVAATVSIAIFIVVILMYIFIGTWYDTKFKKNCFACKQYHLFDVGSCGNGCRYKCDKLNRMDNLNMNTKYKHVKCKHFEAK